MTPDLRKRYKVWLKQSQFDLDAAESSLQNQSYEWVCYQATQSVEKSLKAVIVHSGYLPPKTHKLGILVSIANKSNDVFEKVKFQFRKVEAYTFISRYPFIIPGRDITPHEMIDKDDAVTCLNLAKDIYDKVAAFLEQMPASSPKDIDMADYYYEPEQVQMRLDDIVEKLKAAEMLEVQKIILFGGFAREKTRPKTSTMDIMIVANTGLNFFERSQYAREVTKGGEPIVEPLVYTPDEFNNMLNEEGEGFVESALKEGKILYEKKPEMLKS